MATGKITGAVEVTRLPPHRGVILSLYFFPVANEQSPPPHNGDPGPDDLGDYAEICNDVDINVETSQEARDFPFVITPPTGCYYFQVRVVLFRKQGEKHLAQTEQFFFNRRPLWITGTPVEGLILPIEWPDIPIENLYYYETIRPKANRPWWRFW